MRVLPALFILWFLSFIDRVNIGMARLGGMEKDLHMAGNDFNIAMIIFFPPFILMEVPMNLILKKVSPGIWLPTQNFLLGEPYISLSRMKILTRLQLCLLSVRELSRPRRDCML